MIGWILLVAGLAGAVFLAWRDEYRQKNDSLKQLESFRESKDDKRRKAREDMFQSCMAMLKNESPIFSFHVVIRHKAYNLDENDEVNWLCDEIGKTTYEHPFTNIGSCVPKKDRKEFLRWTDLFTDYDVISGNSADHYRAAEQWRVEHNYPNPTQQERVDAAFTKALGPPSVTASKQPSPTVDKGASPPSLT